MTTSTRIEGASIAGAGIDDSQKPNILLRAVIFISIHVAIIGAGFLLSQG